MLEAISFMLASFKARSLCFPTSETMKDLRMFLAKVDIAVLMLHSFSAGVTSLLLVYAGVVGDGSPLAHLLSLCLFLVYSGAVLRVLWRGKQRRRRG
jgi:hypothetical protein